jgi:hypothetical protein
VPGASDDPFFFKPYEPASADAQDAPEQASAQGGAAARKRSAREVPALLGGRKA